MHPDRKMRSVAGGAALVAGVALIGTTGALFVLGWCLWAAGLGALLTAVPTAGAGRNEHPQATVTPLPSGRDFKSQAA